jgi:transposase
MRDRSREIARLEWLLEDAGIKLSLVASELNAVSSRAMLSALINGERDPAVLANLAVGCAPNPRCRVEALTGRFRSSHLS